MRRFAAALLAAVALPGADGDDDAPRAAAVVDQIRYAELDRQYREFMEDSVEKAVDGRR